MTVVLLYLATIAVCVVGFGGSVSGWSAAGFVLVAGGQVFLAVERRRR